MVHSKNPVVSLETFCKFTNEHALWKSSKKFMSVLPQAHKRKHYYILGQLAAASIGFVGCGPEYLRNKPANYMFGYVLSVDFTFDDLQFNSDIEKDIFD